MTDDATGWFEDEIGEINSFFVGLMKERTPNKAEALQRVVDQCGVHFQVEPDDERCHFSSQSRNGTITAGPKGAARPPYPAAPGLGSAAPSV